MFSTIVADPPWPYGSTGVHLPDKSGGRNIDGRGANVSSDHRYGKLSIDDLCAMNVPAADNAHLYLWMTKLVRRGGVQSRSRMGLPACSADHLGQAA
jgi:hypothetical protein